MDHYSKYLKYKNKYLNLIAGSRGLRPPYSNIQKQFLRHEQRETDPPTPHEQRETDPPTPHEQDPSNVQLQGPPTPPSNVQLHGPPTPHDEQGPPTPHDEQGPSNVQREQGPCGNILEQYREKQIDLLLRGINLNNTRIFLKTNNPYLQDPYLEDPYLQERINKISQVNNHIPRYYNYFNINMKRIEKFNFRNIIDTINRNSHLICSSYNRDNDIQLGITETRKENENVYQTASRGIYEEIGLHIPVGYIQQHNQNFILLHRNDNGILSYRWAVHLIIINGDDFFNDGIANNNDQYASENNNRNVNIIDDIKRFNDRIDIIRNIEENNIRSVHILLYGTNLKNILIKFRTIKPSIICRNLRGATQREYINIDPVLIPTQDLYYLFLRNMQRGNRLTLN